MEPEDSRLNPFQEMADKHSMHIMVGSPYQEYQKIFISAFLYRPKESPMVYTKHYLHGGEEDYFDPGSKQLAFNISDEKLFTAICADIAHHEHAEMAANENSTVFVAGVLITPGGYDEDATILQSYSKKHGMMVLMANYASPTGGWETAGKSAVWDRSGKLIAVAPSQGESLVIVSKIQGKYHGKVIHLD
jgi:predicted amidohydrolase